MSGPDVGSGGFADVDASGQASSLAVYLDEQSAHPFFREQKRRGLDALRLSAGDRALDVGCGLGNEVRALAELVGPNGLAVGADSSRALIREARERSEGCSNVEFRVANASALPFADASFDAVRTERTLQHLPDPAAALAEMVRVARPGGRVAAFEPDWSRLRIDGDPADVGEAICARWRSGIRQPEIGRRLVELYPAAGLEVERAEEATVTLDQLAFAELQFGLSKLAAEEGTAAAGWLDGLRRLDEVGRFRARTTYVFVVGRR